MSGKRKSSVRANRERMNRRGMVRVEVHVRKEYAGLVRGVAAALGDPKREVETSKILREKIAPSRRDLTELLASAPLGGIDVDRPRDFGREVEI